ncbi:MAG TPA: acyltransferase family protein [Acidimicrobiales bacterium]|nr:acyltransferase family protein [Acidimicrobiales bacterium]
MRYRPEIDGVRALAVVAVVAYHAGLPGFGGGFVGVDVFFVISGFLITGLLVGEVDRSGRLSLAGFYGRRARRLLPVAALVTVTTVAVGWWVLSPLDRPDLSADALATSTYTVNLRLAAQQFDYLRSDLDPSAFQQFWSLAVEEQFYLVWPLVLLAAFRGRDRRRTTGLTVGAVVVVSFATCLWWVRVAPEWAFFALPARAWQLGLGALLALAWPRVGRLDEGRRRAAQLAGLVLIGVAVVGAGRVGAWPGPWALVPTLATVAVLAGPERAPRWLEARPLTWVGERSYSWYLWHWPAMVFVAAALDRSIGGPPAVLAGVATLGLAHLTYAWLEQPVRRAPALVASPRASVALGLSVTVVLALAFAGLHLRDPGVEGEGVAAPESVATVDAARLDAAAGTTAVPRNLTPALDDARADVPVVFTDGCNGALGATPVDDARIEGCSYGAPNGDRTVVLVGDSHAAQWVPALVPAARAAGPRLVVLTKSACPIADLTVANQLLGRAYTECDQWRDDVVVALDRLDPELVVAASTSHYDALGPSGAEATSDDWTAGLTTTLAAFADVAPTVLLGDTPYPAGDVPACLAEHLDDATACTLARGQLSFDHARVEAQAASDAGVALVPTVDLACGAQRCPVVVGRFLVYRDASHLATPYVEHLGPQLARLVEGGAARAGATPGLLGVG